MADSARKTRILNACVEALRQRSPRDIKMQDIATASRSSNALVVLHFKTLELLLVEACLVVFTAIARRCSDAITERVAERLEPGAPALSYADAAKIVTDLEAWEWRCIAFAEPRMASAHKLEEFRNIVLPVLGRLAAETALPSGKDVAQTRICADIFVAYYSHSARLIAQGLLSRQTLEERLIDVARIVAPRPN